MATVEATTDSGKTALESGGAYSTTPASRPPANFFCADLILRVFLFAVSLSALVVLVTAKQTVMVPVQLTPPFVFAPVAAKFKDSPALIYLLVALCVTSLYSLVTAASSLRLISSSTSSAKTLFLLVLLDVFYAGVMTSATGTAGAVAWVGLKGNSHTRWNKICNVYGKFCRHIGSSTFLALIASLVLVLLAVLNAYSLYRLSR